jgi:DNA invertase Pin-like site-specific DNA recombinase
VQLKKLGGCDKVFKEKRSLEYLREGDTLLVTKIDRLARSTSDLYRIVSLLADKGVAFKVIDDPSIDTTSRIAAKKERSASKNEPKGGVLNNQVLAKGRK